MSVTSEELLEFVRAMSQPEIKRDSDGSIEYTRCSLEGADLAKALESVKDLVEVEAALETANRSHEAHMKLHNRVNPLVAPDEGHGNYN